MRNVLLIFLILQLCYSNGNAQSCDLNSSAISFENSDKTTLTTFVASETFIVINSPENGAQESVVVILDSMDVIVNIGQRSDCQNSYILPGDLFSDSDQHEFYKLREINWDSLETSLIIGQSIDSLAGCFQLSNVLRVNDIKVNSLTEIANVEGRLNPDHLNISGGVATLNDIIVAGPNRALDVCLIDTINRSFNVFGSFGENSAWVVTTRMGEVLDILDTPVFNFSSYALRAESNPLLHEIEIYHISTNGGDGWLTIGNNIKSDLCGSATRNQTARFDINFIECENTCSDGFLNGLEEDRDVCSTDTTIVCNIINREDISCFGLNDGSAEVEITSGIGPFSILWEIGDTTATIQNLSPGTYGVTVSSATGSATECVTAINQPDSLEVNISLTFGVSCSASAIVSGGLEPYTYLWSNAETFISITGIDTLHSVTITDRNGCTASATINADMLSETCGNCTDGIMNGSETGIDCGGECEPCPVDSLNMNPLQLTKAANFVDENDNGFMEVGETVNYVFSVCNAGSTQLTQITIDDPLITVTGGPIIVEAGACDANSFVGTYVITEADSISGMIMNQATAMGLQSDTIMVVDLSDDPNNQEDMDLESDGEPDDPTILILELITECGVEIIDTDNDGDCDVIDDDDDNDGVNDEDDAFPLDPFESVDTDNDGFGDNADADDDNDGVDDRLDAFPLNANESVDTDGDGEGDLADDNDDGDSCDDIVDNDPLVASEDCLVDLDCDVNLGNDSLLIFGGNIKTDIGVSIDSVIVNITRVGDNVRLLSDSNGDYSSSTLPNLFNYQIRPEKTDIAFLGTSTLDMLFAQRHILRLDFLETPYKVIAADVSGNQEVSIVDIIVMRRMILGIIDKWNEGFEWKFVDANATFLDQRKPWPFNQAIEVEDATSSSCENNFIGIKLGDVDNSFEKSETRLHDNQELTYSVSETVNQSTVYSFSLAENSDVFGFQFSLQGLEDEKLKISSTIIDINTDHFYVENGNLHVSWTNPYGQNINADEELFVIELSDTNQDLIFNTDRIVPQIYVNENIETKNLLLHKINKTDPSSIRVTPNPFSDKLFIQIHTDQLSKVELNIVNMNGQHIWELNKNFKSGEHQIQVPISALDGSGMYFYSVRINGKSQSGKIVRY